MLRMRERGRGASRLSVENLLSHSTEKLRRGNLCFRTVLVSKNVKDKRERGHHDFPSKICCLTIPKDFVGETCVSEKFWYRKILWMRGEGRECHDFPLEIVCLTVPKIFAEEPFCVAENFWYRKMSRRRERGHHDFPSKICCLTVPKNFVGQTCVSENFWYRNLLRIIERGGASRLSIENLLSHNAEKLRRGNLCLRKFLVSKKFKYKRERGASRLSIENLLSHYTERLRRGNLCLRKVLVSQNFMDERGR